MAVAAASAAQAGETPPKAAPSRPTICLFSKHVQKVGYAELGPILRDLGFEGCDLTVRAGGHVLPEKANVDLLRAIETIRGAGVEVPMITTDLVSMTQMTAVPVIGIAGQMKVPYFKLGYWRYKANDIETMIASVRRDVAGLVALGRQYGMTAGYHNHSGDYVGEAVWDTRAIIGDMDPRWIGYYFDPCHATAEGGVAGWNISLRMAMPRLKMLAVKDFYWEKTGGKWKMRMCPLGEGMVDWPKVFSMLAAARFAGPISLHMEYKPADELRAISNDLAFLKKQVAAAYGGQKT